MPVEFEIKGRFFKVKDRITNELYINDTLDSLKYYRDSSDVFTFFPKGAAVNTQQYRRITQVGGSINANGEGRNEFPFTDIVDSSGSAFADADTLELWLASNLGYIVEVPTAQNHSSLNLDDGTNPHGTTKTDVGLSNCDNTSDLDKPVSTDTQTQLDLKLSNNYVQGWNVFTNITNNAWTVNTLPPSYQDKYLFVTCKTINNNRTVGIRQVGSTLTRSYRIDLDSAGAFMVYCNSLGQVEVFNSANGVEWQVQMILPSI